MDMGNAHCLMSLPSTLAFCFKYYGKDNILGSTDGIN